MVAGAVGLIQGFVADFACPARGVEPGLAPFSRGQDTVVPDTEPAVATAASILSTDSARS